ncbi:MAG: hypothetical protein N2257_04225 [Thermodesulfovibrionales bacterium]|nr:hypothetical protein [Thermodesulfovibrionales bacterium]
MDYKVSCQCGKYIASFSFRDNIMPPEVVNRLFCPECSGDINFDPSSMIVDNGWIIEYDMDVARFAARVLPVKDITPEFIFDKGYCAWRGMYPLDYIDSMNERQKIIELAKSNPVRYLEELKRWGIMRMERLKKEGWRKAREGEKIWI